MRLLALYYFNSIVSASTNSSRLLLLRPAHVATSDHCHRPTLTPRRCCYLGVLEKVWYTSCLALTVYDTGVTPEQG